MLTAAEQSRGSHHGEPRWHGQDTLLKVALAKSQRSHRMEEEVRAHGREREAPSLRPRAVQRTGEAVPRRTQAVPAALPCPHQFAGRGGP